MPLLVDGGVRVRVLAGAYRGAPDPAPSRIPIKFEPGSKGDRDISGLRLVLSWIHVVYDLCRSYEVVAHIQNYCVTLLSRIRFLSFVNREAGLWLAHHLFYVSAYGYM